jgi:hypothetical protein
MPLLDAGALLMTRNAVQYLPKAVNPMRGKVDGHIYSVNNPTQNRLNGRPTAIPLPKFLEGYWFTPCRVIG